MTIDLFGRADGAKASTLLDRMHKGTRQAGSVFRVVNRDTKPLLAQWGDPCRAAGCITGDMGVAMLPRPGSGISAAHALPTASFARFRGPCQRYATEAPIGRIRLRHTSPHLLLSRSPRGQDLPGSVDNGGLHRPRVRPSLAVTSRPCRSGMTLVFPGTLGTSPRPIASPSTRRAPTGDSRHHNMRSPERAPRLSFGLKRGPATGLRRSPARRGGQGAGPPCPARRAQARDPLPPSPPARPPAGTRAWP